MPPPEKLDEYLATADRLLAKALGRPRSKRIDNKALDKYADMDSKRTDAYKLADRYYEGDQDTMLTDRAKQYLERSGLSYAENICAVVADAYAERLVIVGVTTSEDEKAPEANPLTGETPPKPMDLADWLWRRVWDGSQGDERQIDIHNDVARRGDGFIIVDYDTEKLRPTIIRQLPETVKCVYEDGVKVAAVKKWYTSEASPVNPEGRRVCRMNVYYPDRIEKWMRLHDNPSSSGGWIEWVDEGDPVWPTDWIGPDGKPLGIPVFHLANKPGDDAYGEYEHRQVIPLQDRLNKELLDLSAILDAMGAPQRWATGVEDTSQLKTAPGEVWTTGGENAKFGQFDPADPAGPLKSIESTITRSVKISRTPEYMLNLSGGTPSGEAVHASDRGLVSKIEGRQPKLGNQWAEVLRMATLVALTFGGTSDEEQPPVPIDVARRATININWKDPRTFNQLEHLQALQIMAELGIPQEYLWGRIEGIDVDQIKHLKVQTDMEAAAQLAAQFNRGGQTNPAEPGQGLPPGAIRVPPALAKPS